jgi:hypothetical protein
MGDDDMDETERGKILELRKPYQCGYRGQDLIRERHRSVAPERGEELAHSVMQTFLVTLDGELVSDNVNDLWQAIEGVISYQMALLCPDCRQKLAEKLRADIPVMLMRASQMVPDARAQYGEFHLY